MQAACSCKYGDEKMDKNKEYIDRSLKIDEIRENLKTDGYFEDGRCGEKLISICEKVLNMINKAYRKGYEAGQREVNAVDRKAE